MKKILVSAIMLVGLGSAVSAQEMPVTEVISSTMTAPVVSVSSFTATQMDSAARALTGRKFIAMQNFDTTYKVWCNFNSFDVGVDKGFFIPENGAIISIPLGYGAVSSTYAPQTRITIYCMTANTTGPSKVSFIQGF